MVQTRTPKQSPHKQLLVKAKQLLVNAKQLLAKNNPAAQASPDVNGFVDKTDYTLLQNAVKQLNVKAAQDLLTKGADPNKPSRSGSTTLHVFLTSIVDNLNGLNIALSEAKPNLPELKAKVENTKQTLEKGANTTLDLLLCFGLDTTMHSHPVYKRLNGRFESVCFKIRASLSEEKASWLQQAKDALFSDQLYPLRMQVNEMKLSYYYSLRFVPEEMKKAVDEIKKEGDAVTLSSLQATIVGANFSQPVLRIVVGYLNANPSQVALIRREKKQVIFFWKTAPPEYTLETVADRKFPSF